MIAIVLAILLFGIATVIQRRLVEREATVTCLVMTQELLENELATQEHFKKVEIPISLVITQKIVNRWEEIEGLYAKDHLYAGQIVMRQQFDTKENLSIYEAEEGKEKIAIKIKNAENGMAYQIKENSWVHVYATLRNEYANQLAMEKERLTIGDEYDGYTVIKLLENVKVLGAFTIDGMEYEKKEEDHIDTILLCVTPEEAKQINAIRELATFNVTGIQNPTVLTEEQDSVDKQAEEWDGSGEEEKNESVFVGE